MAAITGKHIREFIEPFRVQPGKKIVLAKDFDPSYKADFLTRDEGEELLQQGIEALAEYQARLAAQDTYAVLVCLQALDAAGKDGTIRHVMSGVNPQGVEVHGFKVPSAEELDHDYLWRYQQRLPARGNIGIFNRSHYEEVLVVRVHEQVLANEKLPEAPPGVAADPVDEELEKKARVEDDPDDDPPGKKHGKKRGKGSKKGKKK